MTSSSRISLILLVFFLVPTVVFSIKCYETKKAKPNDPPDQLDCPSDKKKCIKVIAKGGSQPAQYHCEDDKLPDGWTDEKWGATRVEVLRCSADLCNSPQAVRVIRTTSPVTTTRPGPTRDPSSSSQGTGVPWICLCLMGVMTSWLLVIN